LENETFKQKDILTFEIVKSIPGRKEKIKMAVADTDNFWEPHVIKIEDHKVWEKATMPDFIDLHIESLVQDYKLLDKGEILHIQLKHFERFLDKAIKHGLHRIYAVHGLGKGKLKSEIEKILNATPEVISYNNNHNVRFGYGATEVYL
ncbi:MAG: Smr/MutS family protein, partial [Chitinophagales bacterium]